MAIKKTIREQSIEELLPHLLALGDGALTKLEQALLEEILINNNTFTDLTKSIQLPTLRQKTVFGNAIKQLIKTLHVAKDRVNTFSILEKELVTTKRKLEALEETINRKNKLSPEVKELLPIKIDTLGFSSRLLNICLNANINKVSDLVCHSRRGFLNSRNCGKLSIDEVDTFFKKNGLEWEMKI